MKTPIKTLLNVSIFILVLSCSEDTLRQFPEEIGQRMPITLSAAYPTATRASDAGFEHGDQMGVYVLDYDNNTPQNIASSDIHASNVGFDFNSGDNTWCASSDIYWTSKNTPADIIGYYPFSSSIEDPNNYTFSISRHQDIVAEGNEPGGYEASDFLWAKAEKIMPSSSCVNLAFRHMMAGVRVTLMEGEGFSEGEWERLEKMVVLPNILPSTTIDLATGNLGNATGKPSSINIYKYNDDWRGIVVPQTIDAGKNVIDISVDNVSYHLQKDESIEYKSGKLNTFTITVNKKSASGAYEFTLTNECIINWLDDVDFHGTLIKNYTVINVPTRGSLQDEIRKKEFDETLITNLKIIGEIDENDFLFIREKMDILSALNLKDAVVYDGDIINKIPDSALASKKSLTNIIFPKNLKIIGANAFAHTGLVGDLIIPEGVTHIGTFLSSGANGGGFGAFRECVSLAGNLSLPSTLLYIEASAFQSTSLSGNLILPEKLQYIGGSAFRDCKFTGELNIPETVKSIGEEAFYNNQFSGNLKIPSRIQIINKRAFYNAFISGTLHMHNHIIEIGTEAFSHCKFNGELKLPKQLKIIGNGVFYNSNYSSVIFNDELISIGNMCFAHNERLTGTIEIPDRITSIKFGTFEECPMLEEVVLGEHITQIEGFAFGNCYNLKSFIVKNPEPPVLNSRYDTSNNREVFEGVPKANFTLQVPEQSVDLYSQASGWKDFKRIAYSNFVCRPSSACALNNSHQETLVLNSDGPWTLTHKPEWCDISKESGNGKTEITLTFNNLEKGRGNRSDYVEFTMTESGYTTKCEVSQYDYQYDEDQCITLHSHSKGEGIDILFIGDGFDGEAISNGSYMNLVNEQMNAFFGLEPYKTYKDYFNVYACISLSQETGVNTANTWRNTRFMTLFTHDLDGNPTLLHEDPDVVYDYAVSKSPLTYDKLSKSLIITTLNSDEYGGATTLRWDGAAISICSNSSDPYPMDVRGIVQHEACGHGFGKLAEERIISNRYILSYEKNYISECQNNGWYQNISLTGKISDVNWSDFIFDPRYSDKVDVFEGGYGVTRGIYRAEINSCMNYGIPYFSVAARMDIMRRILDYSGEGFTMEKFYATDSDEWGSTGSNTRAIMPAEDMQYINSGLHYPVRIIK